MIIRDRLQALLWDYLIIPEKSSETPGEMGWGGAWEVLFYPG